MNANVRWSVFLFLNVGLLYESNKKRCIMVREWKNLCAKPLKYKQKVYNIIISLPLYLDDYLFGGTQRLTDNHL